MIVCKSLSDLDGGWAEAPRKYLEEICRGFKIDSFEEQLGGSVYIVEKGDRAWTDKSNDVWISCGSDRSIALPLPDVCVDVGEYLCISVITNNAGGDTFFITPNAIASDLVLKNYVRDALVSQSKGCY